MKIYIYDEVDAVTEEWHDEGGLVIITDRDPLDVWNKYARESATDLYPMGVVDQKDSLPKPDRIFEVWGNAAEEVLVFPNAGCC